MVGDQGVGAPDGTGSHPSDQAPEGLGAARFDPSRKDVLIQQRDTMLRQVTALENKLAGLDMAIRVSSDT